MVTRYSMYQKYLFFTQNWYMVTHKRKVIKESNQRKLIKKNLPLLYRIVWGRKRIKRKDFYVN